MTHILGSGRGRRYSRGTGRTSHAVALAEALAGAEARREPLALPATIGLDEEDAYEAQEHFVALRRVRTGEAVAGYKISMTSPETRALAGASEPAFGRLTTGMVLQSPATLSLREMFEPRLEPEIQFLVREDLSPAASAEEVARKCLVAAGVEIPDSRFRGWFGKLSVSAIVADDAVAGHVVVAQRLKNPRTLDLRTVRAQVFLGDDLILAGVGETVMGDPLLAVTWLTDCLARRGERLRSGTVVSSGTLALPYALREGKYRAFFEGLGEVRFTVVP